MKIKRFLTHPVLLILSFLLIIISGKHLGGFYMVYLMLALPHGGVHAITGIIGIAILVYSILVYKRLYKYSIESILNIVGSLLLILSLYLFFYNDKENYNVGTFEQFVPLSTLIIFGLLSLGFLISNIFPSTNKKQMNGTFSVS